MQRRTPADWQQLIDDHKQSGLSAVAFCKERNINPKYFSLRKCAAEQSPLPAFAVAQVTPRPPSSINLTWQGAEIKLPASVSPQWVAQLCRELSA